MAYSHSVLSLPSASLVAAGLAGEKNERRPAPRNFTRRAQANNPIIHWIEWHKLTTLVNNTPGDLFRAICSAH